VISKYGINSLEGGLVMKLYTPSKRTFYISIILAGLGLIGTIVNIPFVSGIAFWCLFVSYIILVAEMLGGW
jgi:hypothetical protein